MSATSSPQGFIPVFHPSGQIVANPYPSVNTAAAIYKGDPVKIDTTSGVIIAGVNDAILGVFAGCEYVDVDGKPNVKPYWPGSTSGATNVTFYVYDDPFIEYDVQSGINGTALAATAVGDSADSVIATGSTYTGVTGSYLSATLSGAGGPNQWRIIGVSGQIGNAWGDAYTIARVKIAKSQLITTPAAV